ncbi:hypothetical protein FRC08_013827 [Ceratobasidium sp. 394]|nr:hypothetical protein FRC08_013827 [Ceratobasidium sp. 394]
MTSHSKSNAILATGALLMANAPGVVARRCYYDRFGRYRCTSGLATAARIGIGIGMAVLGLLILGCLLCVLIMRRRKARARGGMVALPPPATSGGPGQYEKQAQPQSGSYQPYPGGGAEYPNQTGGTNYGSAGPQFPEPSYQPAGGYNAPSGPPPNTTYAPPTGPPPGK